MTQAVYTPESRPSFLSAPKRSPVFMRPAPRCARRVPGEVFRNDAPPVLVPQQDVVVLPQQAYRSRDLGVGARCLGHVEQLPAVLVAERHEPRAQPLEHHLQSRQARPVLHVHDRGGAEGLEVAERQLVDRRLGVELAAGPRLERRVFRLPAPTPHAARRNLHQRHVDGHSKAELRNGLADAALDQAAGDLARRQRLVGQQLPNGAHEPTARRPAHAAPDGAGPAVQHVLHQRPQKERVPHGDQVDRPPHQGDAHRLPLGEHPPQLVGVEPLEARPQPVIRRHRRLCLQPDEALDRLRHQDVHAAQQRLTRQQRPIERPSPENAVAHRQAGWRSPRPPAA